MKKRNVCIILTLLLLGFLTSGLFLSSCANNDKQTSDTNKSKDEGEAGDNSPDDSESKNDDGVMFKGMNFDNQEVRILSYAGTTSFDLEEASADIVEDEIYKRNMRVQDQLGVVFKFIKSEEEDSNDLVVRTVRSDTDDFDIIVGVQHECVKLVTENVFLNMLDLPNLDFNNIWWAKNYIDELRVGNDRIFFATGDVSPGYIEWIGAMFYNKKLYKDYIGENTEELYDIVLEGRWTIDLLNEMVKDIYADLDGNNKKSNDDLYGVNSITGGSADYYTYGSGIRATARDENGYPYMILNNERTIDFYDKLFYLYRRNPGTFYLPNSGENYNFMVEKFIADEILFHPGSFFTNDLLRGMKSDYGIIPYPKYLESEPGYKSLCHDASPLLCIPVTCTKENVIGPVLELLAYEGYQTVTPAYFNIVLKNKYMRDTDDRATMIVDMIRENAMTDFAHAYTLILNRVGFILRDLLYDGNKNFASQYNKIEEQVNASLEELINAYLN